MKRYAFALALGFTALAALAAPVPKEPEKLAPPTEKEFKASEENLKKIGIAIHEYYDVQNALPGNTVDKKGEPKLSWRVLLLPHLGEEKLYKEFKLDEPWDSKTNKALLEKMPKVFTPIRVKAEKGQTFYRAFDGDDTMFETGKKLTFANVTDGLSNTIMVVEAGEACFWTKPDDLPYGPKKPLAKLGGLFDGDFHVLMGDGSVQRGYGKKMNPGEFHKLITRSDGNVVDPEAALGQENKEE